MQRGVFLNDLPIGFRIGRDLTCINGNRHLLGRISFLELRDEIEVLIEVQNGIIRSDQVLGLHTDGQRICCVHRQRRIKRNRVLLCDLVIADALIVRTTDFIISVAVRCQYNILWQFKGQQRTCVLRIRQIRHGILQHILELFASLHNTVIVIDDNHSIQLQVRCGLIRSEYLEHTIVVGKQHSRRQNDRQ